jgi:hypothetical protein
MHYNNLFIPFDNANIQKIERICKYYTSKALSLTLPYNQISKPRPQLALLERGTYKLVRAARYCIRQLLY